MTAEMAAQAPLGSPIRRKHFSWGLGGGDQPALTETEGTAVFPFVIHSPNGLASR